MPPPFYCSKQLKASVLKFSEVINVESEFENLCFCPWLNQFTLHVLPQTFQIKFKNLSNDTWAKSQKSQQSHKSAKLSSCAPTKGIVDPVFQPADFFVFFNQMIQLCFGEACPNILQFRFIYPEKVCPNIIEPWPSSSWFVQQELPAQSEKANQVPPP